jgi:hypothetical protein
MLCAVRQPLAEKDFIAATRAQWTWSGNPMPQAATSSCCAQPRIFLWTPLSQKPVDASQYVARTPNVTFCASMTDPPTDTVVARVYSAGTAGGDTRCHSDAPGMTRGGDTHVTSPPGGTEADPPPVTTTLPAASMTATAMLAVTAAPLVALLHSWTSGTTAESATGVPSARQVMAPVTFDGAYTPYVAMYGPGVEMAVNQTWREMPPPAYHHAPSGFVASSSTAMTLSPGRSDEALSQ